MLFPSASCIMQKQRYPGVAQLGSDASAACGGFSELSEWLRSADTEGACRRQRCRVPQQEARLLWEPILIEYLSRCSAVGSAPALGAGCREFESRHLDQKPGIRLYGVRAFRLYGKNRCGILRTKQVSCFGPNARALPGADKAKCVCVQRSKKSRIFTRYEDFFGHRKPAAKPRMPRVRVSPLGPKMQEWLDAIPAFFF